MATDTVNETFVDLLATALADADIRRRLATILDLPPFHRKSALGTFVQEMRLKGAPPDFIRAFEALRQDAVAEKALGILKEKAR